MISLSFSTILINNMKNKSRVTSLGNVVVNNLRINVVIIKVTHFKVKSNSNPISIKEEGKI